MKLTMPDTLAAIIGHRVMDERWPHIEGLSTFLGQSSFDDNGSTYLPDDERGLPNLGSLKFERIKKRDELGLPLDDLPPEPTPDFAQEHSARINYMPEVFFIQ